MTMKLALSLLLLAACTCSALAQCDSSAPRNDCGFVGIDQQQCEGQGCCWMPVDPNPGNLPWCVFPNSPVAGYQLDSLTKTDTGFTGSLSLLQGGDPQYGTDITPLSLLVEYETETRLHVKITETGSNRWEVPTSIVPRSSPSTAASNPTYDFSATESPFGFAVSRNNGEVLFNTTTDSDVTFSGLQFKDQYLSLSTRIDSSCTIYGLEESTQSAGLALQRNGNVYTMWNRDTPSSVTNQNLYGSHPFYMSVAADGSSHGVLLLNSNGMDVTLNSDYITYQVIGGVLDFYFFTGPLPEDVVRQYANFVGLPHMQPFWAFGFHQSAYGMPSIDYVEQVVANYSAANIPLDTIWSDIDYMDEYKDFTFDPTNYPLEEVQSFCDELHSQNQHYVPIIDPGIKVEQDYASYQDLLSNGAYIHDSSGNPFQGQVWPGYTIFPDFLNPDAQDYWNSEISTFLKDVPFDGLWIDMNEISNFCNGECVGQAPPPLGSTSCGCGGKKRDDVVHVRGMKRDNTLDGPTDPPFAINNGGSRQPLNVKTLDMDATHNDTIEYNAHNLYGISESIATRAALEKFYTNTRSFVLSRSTFVGSGAHVSHWTGDNESTWDDMFYSIVGMLSFNMLGVPMVGADICGFNGSTDEEMCTRWMQVGAFSPFCRNHNAIGQLPQELYRWSDTTVVGQGVLAVRYSLSQHFYFLMYRSATNGSAILRPLFYSFPADQNTHLLDRQFLVGEAIMVAPVLDQGATSVNVYFPAQQTFDTMYYDFFSYEPLTVKAGAGTNKTVQNALTAGAPPLYFVGGNVVARRDPGVTILDTRANPLNLTVALDANGFAFGGVFIDDGISFDYQTSNKFTQMEFMAQNGQLVGTALQSSFASTATVSTAVKDIVVLGVSAAPATVSVNGDSVMFSYNEGTLSFSVDLDVNKDFTVSWS